MLCVLSQRHTKWLIFFVFFFCCCFARRENEGEMTSMLNNPHMTRRVETVFDEK